MNKAYLIKVTFSGPPYYVYCDGNTFVEDPDEACRFSSLAEAFVEAIALTGRREDVTSLLIQDMSAPIDRRKTKANS